MLNVTDLVVRRDGSLILDHLHLHIDAGERVSLHGPSGCGKTTLLHAIAGLVDVESGTISVAGHDVTRTPPHRRGVGLVFQDNRLFPQFSVAENIAYGLRVRGLPRPQRRQIAADWLNRVGLNGFDERDVHSLSGGEAKRVALARALAVEPGLLLLDEPLTGLDAELHGSLLDDLRTLFTSLRTTVLHVTHDRSEGARLCDRAVDFESLSRLSD